MAKIKYDNHGNKIYEMSNDGYEAWYGYDANGNVIHELWWYKGNKIHETWK